MMGINENGTSLNFGQLTFSPEFLKEIPFIIFFVALFVFVIISVALLYHWFRYGRGNINRTAVIIVYFTGAFIFLGGAYTSALLLVY